MSNIIGKAFLHEEGKSFQDSCEVHVTMPNGRRDFLCDTFAGHIDRKGRKGVDDAYAARIISCWNACNGMDDPEKNIESIKLERDALLSALKKITELPATIGHAYQMIDLAEKAMGVKEADKRKM